MPEDIIIAPSGLGNHIDHRVVNAAVRGLENKVRFYEEFFYDINGESEAGYQFVFLTKNEVDSKITSMSMYKKTLRKLFGKKWRERMTDYFTMTRTRDGKPYEKFDNTDFIA